MTYDDLRLLIDYHYRARDRVLDAISAITPEQFTRPMGNSFSSIRDTVVHICAAERIWITRLKRDEPQGLQKPDRLPDVDAARKEWSELEGEMREQLASLGPEAVNRTVEYQDLRGNDQSDVLWQMLQHVVNHGTYHRGQITTMLRQMDAAPPKSMDLIAIHREGNGRLDRVSTERPAIAVELFAFLHGRCKTRPIAPENFCHRGVSTALSS